MNEGRVRIDLWLWRARLAKTRTAAARLVSEGRVRLVRAGGSRAIDKASNEVGIGDVVVTAGRATLQAVRVNALGARRASPAEARALYSIIESEDT